MNLFSVTSILFTCLVPGLFGRGIVKYDNSMKEKESNGAVNQAGSLATNHKDHKEQRPLVATHDRSHAKHGKEKSDIDFKRKQPTQNKADKLTDKEEKEVVHALVNQLMLLMKNNTDTSEKQEQASKKAMIWPNKMIPWLEKMLMNKLYGNGLGGGATERIADMGGVAQGALANPNGDSELPTGLVQENVNRIQNEFPDNYDGFVSKSRMHHRHLRLFPLLKMLKSKLSSGNVGMNGAPNFVAKQLLNQVMGGAPDRGTVIREMMQELSMSNGNNRDDTEAREAFNELMGRNNLLSLPQTSLLPGLGPGTTSLPQEKPVNLFPGMSPQQMQNTLMQSEQPMLLGRGGDGDAIASFASQGQQAQGQGFLANQIQARLGQQTGLPRPLMQKLMAEGDTLEELNEPMRTQAGAMLSNAQSPMGSARTTELQLERAQTQLGQARTQLQQAPHLNTNQFVNNQPVIQATHAQSEIPLYRNFRLNQNQVSPIQRSPSPLALRESALLENYNGNENNIEEADVNRLLKLGPNFSAWPKGSLTGRLPGMLGNLDSVAQQRSLNQRLPDTVLGSRSALKYLTPQNNLQSRTQLGSLSPRLAGALAQLRSRDRLGLSSSRLQGMVGNHPLGFQLTALSRLNNQKIAEGQLSRRGNLPEKKHLLKPKGKKAATLILKEKTERRSLEYFDDL